MHFSTLLATATLAHAALKDGSTGPVIVLSTQPYTSYNVYTITLPSASSSAAMGPGISTLTATVTETEAETAFTTILAHSSAPLYPTTLAVVSGGGGGGGGAGNTTAGNATVVPSGTVTTAWTSSPVGGSTGSGAQDTGAATGTLSGPPVPSASAGSGQESKGVKTLPVALGWCAVGVVSAGVVFM